MPAKKPPKQSRARKEAPKKAAASKKVVAKKAVPKKPAKAVAPAKKPVGKKTGDAPLDLSAFPSESITQSEKWICLACILDVFTRHMGLAPKTAHLEITRYTPTLAELYSGEPTRPFFAYGAGADSAAKDPCPYCGSAGKWHARLSVHRIESGKATDALRRGLVKSLPKTGEKFALIEEKATGQHAFFEWLDKISSALNFDEPGWLADLSLHYLSRKEPKVDWRAQFDATRSIRRSRRIETGFEVDQGRLFLAPTLFDELLLVQYLASRSQKAGGLTLEGRYTLPELFGRLRNAGYLRAVGVPAHNPSDALEELLNYLSGGETALKFYHIVDRRELLEKAKTLRLVRPPRPKPQP